MEIHESAMEPATQILVDRIAEGLKDEGSSEEDVMERVKANVKGMAADALEHVALDMENAVCEETRKAATMNRPVLERAIETSRARKRRIEDLVTSEHFRYMKLCSTEEQRRVCPILLDTIQREQELEAATGDGKEGDESADLKNAHLDYEWC